MPEVITDSRGYKQARDNKLTNSCQFVIIHIFLIFELMYLLFIYFLFLN